MTPAPPSRDELLSASYDGELTADERAQVDRLLAESPAARETLDEFRELTGLLQALPRPAAPPALLQGVQRALPRPPRAAVPPARRRRWMLWGAATTAAAVLLLLLQAGRHEDRQHGNVVTTGAQSDARRALESSEGVLLAPSAVEELRFHFAAPATAPAGAPSPSRFQAPAGFGGRLNLADRAADRLVIDPQSPPSVADLLAYVDRVADQTVIVELEVVDVDQTAADMLVLLRRRGVQVVGSPDDLDAHEKVRQAAEAEPMLVGVFVESTDAQLADVMAELPTQVSIQEVATKRADLAQSPLDERLHQFERDYGEIPAERRNSALSATSRRGAPSDRARQLPVSGSPSVAAAAAPSAAGSPQAFRGPDAAAVADESGPDWGARVVLPQSLYRQLDPGEAAAAAGRPDRPPSPPEPIPAAASQPSGDAAAVVVEVRRVLFVLQPPRPE